MKRRAFIAGLGGAAAWPLVGRAQQPRKIWKIGVLWHGANEQQEAIYLNALRKGLAERGYLETRNFELINRFADEHYDRFNSLALELIDAKVDIIVASIGAAAAAVKRANASVPVVFVVVPDPVGLQLVDSLARPGGNMTGLSTLGADLTAKYLELLKDCLPKLSSIVFLYNPTSLVARRYVDDARAAAQSMKATCH